MDMRSAFLIGRQHNFYTSVARARNELQFALSINTNQYVIECVVRGST